MGRKPLADRFNRTLTQVGGQSLSITIPVEYLQELNWEKGKELKVRLNIIILIITIMLMIVVRNQ